MTSDETRRAVTRLWDCLYRKDWDGVAACIADDGLYQDVPAPDRDAVGPANVVRRLRVGLDPVSRFEHELHRMVVDGDTAMLEHTETWHFETGEKIVTRSSRCTSCAAAGSRSGATTGTSESSWRRRRSGGSSVWRDTPRARGPSAAGRAAGRRW
jgi:ketosteroid isomerase-like protein